MDNPIRAMRIFTRIVEMNSFTRAAHALGISRATATRTVQELEAALGMPLLVRTTRALRTTPEGDAYYQRCRRITADVDELEASLRNAARHPSGPLRVELPGSVAGAIVLPALGTFHARHPELVLLLGVSGRAADLIGDAVDCGIRLGALPDSSLVARPLGALERVTCASPAYLERRGVPHSLDALAGHRAVNGAFASGQRAAELEFAMDGAVRKIRLDGVVSVDDEHAYLSCGVHGLGLIQPPRVVAQPLIDAGRLREVLPRWRPGAVPVSAVYAKRRHVSPGVRAFVDWIAERFADAAQDGAGVRVPGAAGRQIAAGAVAASEPDANGRLAAAA
ncbi:LysR family transcriptional regulator [Burkholderia sp. Bp9017]|uniref:LysR family transcriptional regulator n=2 Tax=Burkholderia anthina TaxID=179879 RepID=A0A7T6VLZ4_9BURK|nr:MULTISPECIES: LysR family transcriptional regulator [Burkholderia]QQK06350.1 LysR family transcriptional regulator [Burkholderia anthina]RQZ27531.1 LysR family transcriptional regulator [Burkholderia sp. Bp9016]RQZ30088.1 LysR family transcriptional regulator [Burkholderia sp. Bp9017]